MADGISVDQMRELFEKYFGAGSKKEAEQKDLAAELQQLIKTTEQSVARARTVNRSYAELAKTMTGMNRTVWGSKKSLDDFSKEIEALDEALNRLETSTEQVDNATVRSLLAKRQELANIQTSIAVRTQAIQSMTSFAKSMGSVGAAAVATTGTFLKNAQSGSDAFSLAGDVMKFGIDAVGTATSSAGQGLQTLGGAMMTGSARTRAFGVAAQVAGTALQGFGSAAKAAGNFAVDFFVAEAQKLMGAFNTMSASGAVFSNGMTGLSAASHEAGLSVKQMSSVVQQNASTIAASGMSIAQATNMIGRVGKTMRDSGITTQLLKLGYGFEEQAALTAEVMSDMRRVNSAQLQDPQAIAAATQSYAENLRLIASVTGEDARKKLEEARQASTQVAFRNKLMEMEKRQPGVMQEVMTTMANMDDTTKKAVMQQMVLGTVVDKTANLMMTGSDGYASGIRDITESMQSGVFTAADGITRYGKQMDDTRNQLKNFDAVGQAGIAIGAFGDLNRALMEIINKSDKITEAGVNASKEAITKITTETDKQTLEMVNAMTAAQNVTVKLEQMTQARLDSFTELTAGLLDKIRKIMDDFDEVIAKGLPKPGEGNTISDLISKMGTGISAILDIMMGAGLIKALTGPPRVPTTVESPGKPGPKAPGPEAPKPTTAGQPKPPAPTPQAPTGPAAGTAATSTLAKTATTAATYAAPAAIMAAPVIAAGITKAEIEKNPFDPRFQGVPYAEQLKREQAGEEGLTLGKVGKQQAQRAVVSEGERKTLNELMKRTNEQAREDLKDTDLLRELFKNDEAYSEAIRILADKASKLEEVGVAGVATTAEPETPVIEAPAPTPEIEQGATDIANVMAESASSFASAIAGIVSPASTTFARPNTDWESGFVAAADRTEEQNRAVITDLLAKNQQTMLATTDQIIKEVAGTMQSTTTTISTLNQTTAETNQEVVKTMRELVTYNQRMLEAMEDAVRYQRRIADNTN